MVISILHKYDYNGLGSRAYTESKPISILHKYDYNEHERGYTFLWHSEISILHKYDYNSESKKAREYQTHFNST